MISPPSRLLLGASIALICLMSDFVAAGPTPGPVRVQWRFSGKQVDLIGLEGLGSGDRPVPVFNWLQKAIEPLSNSDQARVDLVVFTDVSGKSVEVPRAFIQRQGLQFTKSSGGYGIAPSMSERAKADALPFERYHLKSLSGILLTNYRTYYDARFFVAVRTDPAVIRGEKRFLVSCLGCHGGQAGGGPDQAGVFLKAISEFQAKGLTVKDLIAHHRMRDELPPYADIDFRSVLKYSTEINGLSATVAAH